MPTPNDYQALFYDKGSKQRLTNAALIVTPNLGIFVLSTNHTPILSPERAEEQTRQYTQNFPMGIQNHTESDLEKFNKMTNEFIAKHEDYDAAEEALDKVATTYFRDAVGFDIDLEQMTEEEKKMALHSAMPKEVFASFLDRLNFYRLQAKEMNLRRKNFANLASNQGLITVARELAVKMFITKDGVHYFDSGI